VTARDDLAARRDDLAKAIGVAIIENADDYAAYGTSDLIATVEGEFDLRKIADAVTAWFQEHTTEEWAVRYERTAMTLETVTQIEHARDERTAHEWVEHKYPPIPTGWNHQAVRRRVTAWEEA
jgi:hypothetical protein